MLDNKAATVLEYGLVAAVFMLTFYVGFNIMGSHVSNLYMRIANILS